MPKSGMITNQGATQLLDSVEDATKDGQLVVLMFAGDNCPPCKQLAPKLNNLLTTKYAQSVICLKFIAEQDRTLTEDEKVFPLYGINNMPTILFVKKGHLVADAPFRLVNPSITQVENCIKQLVL